jgi:DNA-binding MarR family transcriptional regulator
MRQPISSPIVADADTDRGRRGAPTPSLSSMSADVDAHVGFLMYEITHLRLKLWGHAFRKLRLTRAQWWTLGVLSLVGREEGITQTEFAKIMDVKKVAIGKMIDKLEAQGYVERRLDPQDRRAWRIHLTPAGRAAIVEMLKSVKKLLPALNAGITDEEFAVFRTVLGKMRGNLSDIPP